MLKTTLICWIIHCYPEYNITCCTPELDFKTKTIPKYDNVTYRVQLNAWRLEGIPYRLLFPNLKLKNSQIASRALIYPIYDAYDFGAEHRASCLRRLI